MFGDFGTKFLDFGVFGFFRLILVIEDGAAVTLELVEAVVEFDVGVFQFFNLHIALVDGVQQLRVCGLALEEALDERIDVSDARGRLNLFEGLVDLLGVAHFFLHLLAHEGIP